MRMRLGLAVPGAIRSSLPIPPNSELTVVALPLATHLANTWDLLDCLRMSDTFTRTLMITAVGLSLPARLLFTLQEAREDNFGSHPVVWHFIPGSKSVFKAATIYLQYCGIDNPPRPIIYVNRFAFSRVEIENDVIVKTQSSQEVMYRWEVAIEKNDKGEYVFTAPVQGDSNVVR
ncbi:hypothetical protein FRB91_010445, partial [Serendipita sp. 411]